MKNKFKTKFTRNIQRCSNWQAITEAFEQFPLPAIRQDELGVTHQEGWIYRGHQRRHPLEPTIEREAPVTASWAEIEYRTLREFQALAPMHIERDQLPSREDKLGWLAIMQHYGAPTRLLDFTFSPYVALYFAVRNQMEGVRTGKRVQYAEVWAINAASLRKQAEIVLGRAGREAQRLQGREAPAVAAALDPASLLSALQIAEGEDENLDGIMRKVLNPCGVYREQFNRDGFVIVALPPLRNRRLSSQQGVSLLNGAEELTFESSLDRMMEGVEDRWYKRFLISQSEFLAIERHLFQMNVHDLSLFPDREGLAGFVRQKIHLHWS